MLTSMSWTLPTAQGHSFTLSHLLGEPIPYGTHVPVEGSPFRNENCVKPEFPCAEVCRGTLQRYGQPRKVTRVAFQRRRYANEYSVTLSKNSGKKTAGALWSPKQAALRDSSSHIAPRGLPVSLLPQCQWRSICFSSAVLLLKELLALIPKISLLSVHMTPVLFPPSQ